MFKFPFIIVNYYHLRRVDVEHICSNHSKYLCTYTLHNFQVLYLWYVKSSWPKSTSNILIVKSTNSKIYASDAINSLQLINHHLRSQSSWHSISVEKISGPIIILQFIFTTRTLIFGTKYVFLDQTLGYKVLKPQFICALLLI